MKFKNQSRISNLEQLAVSNNLVLFHGVYKRFHNGLLPNAAHVKPVYIIPNCNRVNVPSRKLNAHIKKEKSNKGGSVIFSITNAN